MSLIKKYALSSLLVSIFVISSLPAKAEIAPTPTNDGEIIDIKPAPTSTVIPMPEVTPTSEPYPNYDPTRSPNANPYPSEIPASVEPTRSPMPKSTATAKPTPKKTPVPKKVIKKPAPFVPVQVKKEVPKEQKKLPAIAIETTKENSKYILRPGKITFSTYTAQKGDNLYTLAKRWAMRYRTLLAMNNTDSPYLVIGQKVIVDKSMQPTSNFQGIIVNIPERKLYHFAKGKLIKTYPVSVGLPSPEWQTPAGTYKILYKVKDPIWKVPVSIQKEMAARGQVVKKEVPAGPGNPLGKWWMGLTWTGLGIHSTNAPLSVGYSVSHGCVRMKPTNAAELWSKISTNTPVKVIYQPVKLSVDEKNNVFVEVFRDVYGKTPDMTKYTKAMLNDFALNNRIDWQKASYALRNKRGTSVNISKTL